MTDKIQRALSRCLVRNIDAKELWLGPLEVDKLRWEMQRHAEGEVHIRDGDTFMGLTIRFMQTPGIRVGVTMEP